MQNNSPDVSSPAEENKETAFQRGYSDAKKSFNRTVQSIATSYYVPPPDYKSEYQAGWEKAESEGSAKDDRASGFVALFGAGFVTLAGVFVCWGEGYMLDDPAGYYAGGLIIFWGLLGLLLALGMVTQTPRRFGLAIGIILLLIIGPIVWRRIKARRHTAQVEYSERFIDLYRRFRERYDRRITYPDNWSVKEEDETSGGGYVSGKVLIMTAGYYPHDTLTDPYDEWGTKLTEELMSALPPELSPAHPEEVGSVVVVSTSTGKVQIYVYNVASSKMVASKELPNPGYGYDKNPEEVVKQVMLYVLSLPRR